MAEEKITDPADVEKFEPEGSGIEANSTPVIKEALESIDSREKTENQGTNEGEELIVIFEEKEAKSAEPDKATQEEEVTNNTSKDEKPSGKDELKVGGMRRRSLFVAGVNNNANVPSRYHRPSGGSCHDFCKFGHRNALEEKAKHTPVFRVRNECGDIPKSGFGVQSKKRSVVRRLSFPENIAEKESKLTVKEMKISRKPTSVVKLRISEIPRKTTNKVSEIKTVKRHAVMNQKSLEISTQSVKGTKAGNGEKKSAAQANGSVSSMPRSKESRSVTAELYSNRRALTHSKSQRNFQEVKKPEDVAEKTLHMIEPNGNGKVRGASSSQSMNAQKALSVSRNEGQTSRLSQTKMPTRKETSQPRGREILKTENGRGKQFERVSGDGKSKSATSKAKPTVEPKAKIKRVGTSQMGEKEGSVRKMKFRRGTIVPLPNVSGGPRKLRFKRAKSLTENHTVEGPAKTSKKKEVNGDGPEQSKSGSEKVVLRCHQGPEKKDNVDLNNVLEETAGKLVKMKKSKVRALVGAFETVMSLGDGKTLIASGTS